MSEAKTPWNPSRKATARVKNPFPAPELCRFCGGAVRISTHWEIYGRDFSDWPWVYLCDCCGAYVGMHPFTNIPLGTLADKPTRDARKRCKPAFESLWRNGDMTRSEAYAWLAQQLGIPLQECHFGWFDIRQCERAKQICQGAAQ
ncbi:hypothetical protein E1A40_08815 [Salmonella enterica subsp. enterica serovar Aba]|nr:hypothetical protein [Salmonella enterica subsp. enterica serovar Aba]ECG5317607.1 hypothetical protein [Salmonella enterica subsp. enterica serovar Aba]